jgi:hypothetical protein
MNCFYDILFKDCIHMAGPTSLQSGLKIRLQCMLENIQQFHFAANNIPENPASGMSGLICLKGWRFS